MVHVDLQVAPLWSGPKDQEITSTDNFIHISGFKVIQVQGKITL